MNCSQNCQNTFGSYNCTCEAGFVLNKDMQTCDGKHKPEKIFVTREELVFVIKAGATFSAVYIISDYIHSSNILFY